MTIIINPVLLLSAVLCLLNACGQRRRPEFFQVRAGQPYYILRSPDRTEAPFHETASAYGDPSAGWVSLGERMVLKIEIAFFKEAAPKRDIANFPVWIFKRWPAVLRISPVLQLYSRRGGKGCEYTAFKTLDLYAVPTCPIEPCSRTAAPRRSAWKSS